MKRLRACAWAALCAGLLAACSAAGPDYRRPALDVPRAFKEQPGWKAIEPQDGAARGPWWQVYRDPVLDELERRVEVSNQNLKAAEAAFRQARAAVEEARAGLFPALSASGGAQRSGTRAGQADAVANRYDAALGANWEPDVWGRIRRSVEASAASARASAADLASARLSAQATLATDYFELRAQDELERLLDQTIAGYARTLEITRNQYEAGYVALADVVTAETTLRSAQAQAIQVGVLRAQLEHAIAVLTGQPPAALAIAASAHEDEVPRIPAGLPSALLERNPAIASAEHAVIAANAQIGVNLSAYYPDITLSASYGFASAALGELLHADQALWSLGAAFSQVLFDAGARRARVEQARAAYDQNVAVYRQTVLTAFQQVEDQLATLRILEQEAGARAQAVGLARQAVSLTINEYEAGAVPYTSVVTAQTAELDDEQAALTVRENRLVASVALIEALGGGWSTARLPCPGRLTPACS
jgi:NodT family efflux transporter outer membrane factor (OMF) lipoprotein